MIPYIEPSAFDFSVLFAWKLFLPRNEACSEDLFLFGSSGLQAHLPLEDEATRLHPTQRTEGVALSVDEFMQMASCRQWALGHQAFKECFKR